ncbi:Uncharacterized protein Rs2_19600 [Raphanus sativus]|uniref:Heavy metal-associated isoprenylated plant protein 41-like n=1 Tax=Raphanus sativus TaxID=3726 RepID=A0A6J0P5T1_RAPSA|nr:heavy metal-associated isoprenylated plant protein 41-like [Raphanus sativus]KAJ4892806.1 Uncharacterized protein Rs2_19600 [Raphanus sativus]
MERKQTIVLNVKIADDKYRIKAMKIAAGTKGVTLVQFEKKQDKLKVEGEAVDLGALLQTLKKKVGETIVSGFFPGFNVSQPRNRNLGSTPDTPVSEPDTPV